MLWFIVIATGRVYAQEKEFIIATIPFYEISETRRSLQPIKNFIEKELQIPVKLNIVGAQDKLLKGINHGAYDILITSYVMEDIVNSANYSSWIYIKNDYRGLVVSHLPIDKGDWQLIEGKKVAILNHDTDLYQSFLEMIPETIKFEPVEYANYSRSLFALMDGAVDVAITFEHFYARLSEHKKKNLYLYDISNDKPEILMALNRNSIHYSALKDKAAVFIETHKEEISSAILPNIKLLPVE